MDRYKQYQLGPSKPVSSFIVSVLSVVCPGGSVVNNPPANAGDTGLILGQEDPLEEKMATHSSIHAWDTPWIEESGEL